MRKDKKRALLMISNSTRESADTIWGYVCRLSAMLDRASKEERTLLIEIMQLVECRLSSIRMNCSDIRVIAEE